MSLTVKMCVNVIIYPILQGNRGPNGGAGGVGDQGLRGPQVRDSKKM